MDEAVPLVVGSTPNLPPLRRLCPGGRASDLVNSATSYKALQAGLEDGSLFLPVSVLPPIWTGKHATSGLWASD